MFSWSIAVECNELQWIALFRICRFGLIDMADFSFLSVALYSPDLCRLLGLQYNYSGLFQNNFRFSKTSLTIHPLNPIYYLFRGTVQYWKWNVGHKVKSPESWDIWTWSNPGTNFFPLLIVIFGSLAPTTSSVRPSFTGIFSLTGTLFKGKITPRVEIVFQFEGCCDFVSVFKMFLFII